MLVENITQWQDKVVVLTLDNGDVITVHILSVDSEYSDIIVDVLSSNSDYLDRDRRAYIISPAHILSITPAPVGIVARRPLPQPDPCRARPSFSLDRFVFFTPVFLTMMPGSLIVACLLYDRPYGIQIATILSYSAAVILYTFASNRGMQRYLFRCPSVYRRLSRLALRHVGFLAVLFVLQTVAFSLRPHLPAWWLTSSGRNMTPFAAILGILCIGLGLAQVLTNRSLLNKSHLEYAAD